MLRSDPGACALPSLVDPVEDRCAGDGRRRAGLSRLGARVVTELEALAATLHTAGDESLDVESLRKAMGRVCDALRCLDTASLTHGPAGLPGRWPEPWDDSDDASARRPSAVADRIARGEGTAQQIRALAAGYRWWTGRMSQLDRGYRQSVVDALMLELVENDGAVREAIALAVLRLGEDACAALCAEVRDLEDAGGVWSVATRERRTKGGVWFALLKARYKWARFGMPAPGGARDRAGSVRLAEAARADNVSPATTAPLMPETASAALPAARPVPEVIVLRRRLGAALRDSSPDGPVDDRQRGDVGRSASRVAADAGDA